MSCCNFLKIMYPVLIRSALAGWCGAVKPELQTVAEGTTVQFRLTRAQALPTYIQVRWYYSIPGNLFTILCNSKDEQCKEPTKYTQSKNGQVLTIKTVSQNDSGSYICRCSITPQNNDFSGFGILNVSRANTSANNGQAYQKKISTESTNLYLSTTHSATATVESKRLNTKVTVGSASYVEEDPLKKTGSTNVYRSMSQSATATLENDTLKTEVIAKTSASIMWKSHLKNISTETTIKYFSTTHGVTEVSDTIKTEVIDSARDCKISSTLEDTSQVTTVVVAGGLGIGVMLTVIVVVIICKKKKKDDIHRAGQKSVLTQTNSKGAEGQDKCLLNDYNCLHRGDPSEQEAPAVRHEQKNNSDGQEASGAATEQIDSKYETIRSVTDRDVSIQKKEMYEMIKVEKEDRPEYETVA